MSKVRILIVEDESIVAMDIERRLVTLGYQVIGHVLSGEDAVLRTEEERPNLVLMDIHLKGAMDGIEAAEKIRRLYDIPVIYITAYSDEATLERAKVTEPFGYILKPFQEREIHSAIEMAVYKHRAEQEMREAKEAAVEGYRVRSEFLANISHELRTPLNSILGMSQLAMDSEDAEERHEYLRMVRDSGTHLLNLISSVLDFSKMEAGRIELVEEAFRLDELVEDLLFLIWEHEATEDLSLYIDIDEGSNLSLRGDSTRLRQVIQNLVHNAMKFTSSGYIEVKAWTEDVEKVGKCLLKVVVTDTGIGIPKAEKEEIFSMFYKLDNSLTRVHGGTGLGLAIVKNLIELMGGEIELETQEGRGSSFSFTVPMKVDREDMRPPLRLPAECRVHFLSDDPRAAEIRSTQLKEWGADLDVPAPDRVRGKSGDIWLVSSGCVLGEQIIGRLVKEGVPKEKIILITPGRARGCTKLQGIQKLTDPGTRKQFFSALLEAAEVEVSRERSIDISLPITYSRSESAEEDEGGYASGEQHIEGSEALVCNMLYSFLESAQELLEEENYDEFEETSLQVKQQLERYGFHELKEHLFKLVLAGRRRNRSSIKTGLDYLKEQADSLKIEE